jgi:hypothetical protein
MDLPCSVAAFSILRFPIIVAISMSASVSSLAWKSGNLPTRKKSNITPAAQISTAGCSQEYLVDYQNKGEIDLPPVCSPHLSNTSGGRKPLVPARFAFEIGLETSDKLASRECKRSSVPVPVVLFKVTNTIRRC